MEWTREQRYRPYQQYSALELLHLQAAADNSPEQLRYHIRPSSGLLNDPNGFSYLIMPGTFFTSRFLLVLPMVLNHGCTCNLPI